MVGDVEVCLCIRKMFGVFFCLGLFAGNHLDLALCLIYTETFMFHKASTKTFKDLLEKQSHV